MGYQKLQLILIIACIAINGLMCQASGTNFDKLQQDYSDEVDLETRITDQLEQCWEFKNQTLIYRESDQSSFQARVARQSAVQSVVEYIKSELQFALDQASQNAASMIQMKSMSKKQRKIEAKAFLKLIQKQESKLDLLVQVAMQFDHDLVKEIIDQLDRINDSLTQSIAVDQQNEDHSNSDTFDINTGLIVAIDARCHELESWLAIIQNNIEIIKKDLTVVSSTFF